jgi:hypothetical protein
MHRPLPSIMVWRAMQAKATGPGHAGRGSRYLAYNPGYGPLW